MGYWLRARRVERGRMVYQRGGCARIEWALLCMVHNMRKWAQAVCPCLSPASLLTQLVSCLTRGAGAIANSRIAARGRPTISAYHNILRLPCTA